MKNAKRCITISVFMLFFVASLAINTTPTFAAAEDDASQCFIVSLKGNFLGTATGTGNLTITPQYTSVPVGSCVVWVNWVLGPEISVSFKDGKACSTSTKAAIGYRLTPDTGCFLTDYLLQGETSSLRFMEPGTYSYEIHVKGKVAPVATGKIHATKK